MLKWKYIRKIKAKAELLHVFMSQSDGRPQSFCSPNITIPIICCIAFNTNQIQILAKTKKTLDY